MMPNALIHLSKDIAYLFPATRGTAKVLCGRFASEVTDSGEFIGTINNWNEKCTLCEKCKKELEKINGTEI